MILLIKLILVTSIWVLGLTICTQKDMVLQSIRDVLTDEKGRATKKIYETLIVCHWCMPSIHSVFGYLFVWLSGIAIITTRSFVLYPIVVMGSSIVCGITWQLYKLMEKSFEYYSHKEQLTYFDLKNKKTLYNQRKSHGN